MRNRTIKKSEKPSLTLIPGQNITADSICKMFTAITGKEPTEQDRAEVEAMFDAQVKIKDDPGCKQLIPVLDSQGVRK